MGTEEPPRPPRHGATEPIRPVQGPTEPIPERIRQPIIVPRREETIAGLPRALVLVVVGVLLLAALVGFFIGRATGGDDDEPAAAARGGGSRACRRALQAALEIREIQMQALANRTQATQAALDGDEDLLTQLTLDLEPLVASLRDAENELPALVERCGSDGGRRGGGGRGKRGQND